MNKEITWGKLFISVVIPAFILSIGWAMATSSRLSEQHRAIMDNEKNIDKNEIKVEKVDDKVDENYKIIIDKLDKIIYKLPKD